MGVNIDAGGGWGNDVAGKIEDFPAKYMI